jgi:predicted molibdopterin-dependent oxidoreductase YjgC
MKYSITTFLAFSILASGCGFSPNQSRTKAQMSNLQTAFEIYRKEYGTDPQLDPKNVYHAMWLGNPKKLAIYSPLENEEKAEAFLDAWGNPLTFTRESSGITISSAGADGIKGNQDDLSLKQK